MFEVLIDREIEQDGEKIELTTIDDGEESGILMSSIFGILMPFN